MIYTLKEELRLIILFIIYGIYLASYIEFINIFTNKIKKKINKIIIELLMWIIEIYIAYQFIYKAKDGYIPIYFVLFILVGLVMYLICRKQTLSVYKVIVYTIIKIIQKIKNEIIEVTYPNYLKEIRTNLIKRRRYKKKKDIVANKD